MPLNIPGLDSRLENFVFKSEQKIEGEKTINITILTNRGKIRKKISIPVDIEESF